jgi:excisionase family DNA binding protein
MKTNENPKTLWTRKETANYLRQSQRSIDRLIRSGRIKAFKIGRGKVLIYAESVTEENLNAIRPKFIDLSSNL